MDNRQGTVGGGNILKIFGKKGKPDSMYLDNQLLADFARIPLVKFIIYALLISMMIFLILRLFKVKSPFKSKGIISEMDYIEQVKKRDASILRAQQMMTNITRIVEMTPFNLAKSQVEYWQYNLNRADIRIPGKTRIMKAEEFNAVIKMVTFAVVVIGVTMAIIANALLGAVIIMSAIMISSFMPMAIVRQTVKAKDMEIKEHFSDYYLMIHYVLIANANTPLDRIMRSFARTTDSKEMKRYVDVCIHYIDTYGEYEATRHIAKDYKELPEVGKLMRLIRQANEGGDIEAELNGFRQELIAAKRYAITKRMEKLVSRARASFNVLMPILIQAIISAMSIYWKDLGGASNFLGK